jgi:UDP-N-acetylglucosamine 2-epimerase (non-hydrolysing)
MKILTIIGTRPEIIRLSLIIKKLDDLVEHVLVYTNQNYDYNLSKIFFEELEIRNPNYYFNFETKSIGEFLSKSILEFENILQKEQPDKILILGDTNSGLLGIIGRKYNIPIYHMEAGNRSFDERVPEEANRKIIDSISKYNLPYTENSKQNLLNEGYHKNYVYKIGNPINEVINHYSDKINQSNILNTLNLKENNFVLVTAHRSENVDNDENLKTIIKFLNKISEDKIVIFSVHPRTQSKIKKFSLEINFNIILSKPFGFFDFIKLEKNAYVTISDSGTCGEETYLFGKQSITIRKYTERQELVEYGSTFLTDIDYDTMINCYNSIKNMNNNFTYNDDYFSTNVSDKTIRILLGKN